MAKGEHILICQFGGHFMTREDGTLTYNGGDVTVVRVTSETSFSDLKLRLAETCDLKQETVTVKYFRFFLPGNKRDLITVKNDKDVKRMVGSPGDIPEVFVSGTPGFVCSVPEPQANRQSDTKNDETVNNYPDSKNTRRNRGRVTDEEPGKQRIAKSQRSSNSTASSGSNPAMFLEMFLQQYTLDREAKMERLDRETTARVNLINSQKVAEDLKILAINTSGLDPIDVAIINAQKA